MVQATELHHYSSHCSISGSMLHIPSVTSIVRDIAPTSMRIVATTAANFPTILSCDSGRARSAVYHTQLIVGSDTKATMQYNETSTKRDRSFILIVKEEN